MSHIRLSIIIPFYNVERYIVQCLDSVYMQDIPEEEYEVICVDDCGPDDSRTIVERYARRYANLRIVSYPQNRKLGGARNSGLDVAQGQYIWYVDSDDFIEKNVLATLLETAEKNDLDILHFDHAIYPIEQPQPREIETTETMSGTELFFDNRFRWDMDLITAWCKLYKREFLLNSGIRFVEHMMYEDNDYAIRVFACATRVMHIGMKPYYYRQNESSITRVSVTEQHFLYWIDLAQRLCVLKDQFVAEKQDERYITLLNQFIRYELEYIRNEFREMDANERKRIKPYVLQLAQREYKPYMSLKKYLGLQLGIVL